jgi:AAT family amino acid transporter
LTWNYWFNDAVSTAADLVALQLLLQYWTDNFPGWALSVIFLVLLIGLNIVSVRVYGEMEYWLSFLKVVTIVVRLNSSYPMKDSRSRIIPGLHHTRHRRQLRR